MPQSSKRPVSIAGPVQYLSVDQILASNDLEERDVAVPEWGGKLRIRALSRGQFALARTKATPKGGELDADRWEGQLFVRSVVEPVFTEDQIKQLQDKSYAPYARVITEILRINGMTSGEVDEAQAEFPPES